MEEQKKPLTLVFGATGRSGVHLCNNLIARGYPLRIYVRNKSKVSQIFKEKQIAFESIIEGKIDDILTLERAYLPSQHYGSVKFVFSALGADTMMNVRKIEYDYQVTLIDLNKKYGVEKYFLLSAAGTNKGWFYMTFLLNLIIPNVMEYKAMAENYLRSSGIKYAIFRPPHLLGGSQSEIDSRYEVTQGTIKSSTISRYTLARLMVDCLQAKQVPDKVSIQCSDTKEEGLQSFDKLQPDSEKDIIRTHHRLAKYTYLALFFSIIGIFVFKICNCSEQVNEAL